VKSPGEVARELREQEARIEALRCVPLILKELQELRKLREEKEKTWTKRIVKK